MKREPSIHITKDRLKHIVDEIMDSQRHGVVYSSSKIVDKIFIMAKPYSLSSRNVSVTNDRLEKKVKRLVDTSRIDADLFAQLVYATRKKRKQRGVSPIRPGSKDWDLVKEATASALNFCDDYGLKKREGFIRYLDIGIDKMVKFSLPKLVSLYERICESFSAIQEIEKDNDSSGTEAMCNYYIQHIAEVTGIYEDIKKVPEKYVFFVRARKIADEIKVPGVVYIKAQFEGLDFAKGIPHPAQLIGDKAIERVNRYSYKRNFKKAEFNSQGVPRIKLGKI